MAKNMYKFTGKKERSTTDFMNKMEEIGSA